jgi:hypothetical protein
MVMLLIAAAFAFAVLDLVDYEIVKRERRRDPYCCCASQAEVQSRAASVAAGRRSHGLAS